MKDVKIKFYIRDTGVYIIVVFIKSPNYVFCHPKNKKQKNKDLCDNVVNLYKEINRNPQILN